MKRDIDHNTPIACLTYGQFIDALQEPMQEPKELPHCFTINRAYRIAIATVNIKNRRKEIPGSIKRGGRLLFDSKKILEWIASGAVKTKQERLDELDENLTSRIREK